MPFTCREISFPGFLIGKDGIKVDPKKVQATTGLPLKL